MEKGKVVSGRVVVRFNKSKNARGEMREVKGNRVGRLRGFREPIALASGRIMGDETPR